MDGINRFFDELLFINEFPSIDESGLIERKRLNSVVLLNFFNELFL
jgi:hypothetical protein